MGRCDANLIVEAITGNELRRLEGSLSAAGIDSSWVCSNGSRHSVPVDSDAALVIACRGMSRLQPQLAALPPSTGHDSPARLVGMVSDGACPVVRLCPGARGHHYPLVDWVLTPLPETCEREGLSLAVDYMNERADLPWPEIVSFARAFPAVPIVIIGVDLAVDRAVNGALDSAPNLLLELSRVDSLEPLTRIVDVFGAHRVLFGTGARCWSLSNAITESADLDGAAELILGGNAEQLAAGEWADTYL